MAGRILSMTGFGRGRGDFPGGRVTAEARALNHRFLETSIRAPRELFFFDPEARRLIKQSVARGKVEVFLSVERTRERALLTPERARSLLEQLRPAAELAGDRVTLSHLLAVSQGGAGDSAPADEEPGLAAAAAAALEGALTVLLGHREAEGRTLAEDIGSRLRRMRELREAMLPFAAQALPRVSRQVADFLERWDLTNRIDAGKMEAEVALLAQRADVTEEMTRLAAHLEAMEGLLAGGGSGKAGDGGRGDGVGRRLDFLIQEAGREVNTIGSKASDSALASVVVEAKTELERIREQVQNLE